MRVLGTAGHVDHGKSTLVRALTGINPDRLREEQERQMTIDLGFAWMTLPAGEEVGIIDVPGHRDFIENMLAGVGGIDAALFVVAADEGVMPQTREHLAILDLLQVPSGVVALTKVDLVDDPGWLSLVSEEVRGLLRGTVMENAPLVPVSAERSEGLDELRSALAKALALAPERKDRGRARLSIDRAFSIAGFGTVVTGTLRDGSFVVGEEVEVLPAGARARLRGLQSHKTKVERAVPGSRVAANVTGLEVRDVRRGDVLATPGEYVPTRLVDVHFRLLGDADAPLRHNQEVKLYLGAAQRVARARVLGQEQVQPGDEAWLQLILREPVVAERGDRFILRRPSPGATLGGGEVVEAHPARLHRRRDASAIQSMERHWRGEPAELLEERLRDHHPQALGEALSEVGLTGGEAEEAVGHLEHEGRLVRLGEGRGLEGFVTSPAAWAALLIQMREALGAYHQLYPLRAGMPREELRNRLGLEGRAFAAALAHAVAVGEVEDQGAAVSLPEHKPSLTGSQQADVDSLNSRFKAAPYAPPSLKECQEAVDAEVLAYLFDSGRLVQVSPDVVFDAETYREMVDRVRQEIRTAGTITVARVRDLFATSRKYALALMEHLDAIGITVRVGDERRLANG